MPTYSIRAPDGNTYRINGPAGASRDEVIREVLRQNPDAGIPTPRGSGPRPIQRPNEIERIPYIGPVVAGLADLQINAAQAVHGGIRSVADTFGPETPVADWSRGITNRLESQRSSASRQDQQLNSEGFQTAEGTGFFNEAGAALRAFRRSPGDYIASGLGSLVIPLAATRLAGPAGGVGYGALSGVGMVKGAIYDAVKTEAMRRGQSETEAEALATEAQSYTGENWYNILIGGGLGAATGRFGVERSVTQIAINRALGRMTADQAEAAAARVASNKAVNAAVNAATRRSVAGGAIRGSAAEAVPEMVQAGQERFASNTALNNAGFDTDPFKGVAGQAVLEGVIGGILGAPAGGIEARSQTQMVERLSSILPTLVSVDPEIATDIGDAVDGDTAAKKRLASKMVELLGYDEKMATRAANTYIGLEIQARKAKQGETPSGTGNVEPDEVDAPAPVSTAPTSPAPLAPEEELPQRGSSDVESDISRLTSLRDDDRYIASQSSATGEPDTAIIADLDEQIAALEAQLPPVTNTYTPRTPQERGASLAAQTMSGAVSGVDVDALSPEEKLGYNNTLMEAEFGSTKLSGISNVEPTQDTTSVTEQEVRPEEDFFSGQEVTFEEPKALTPPNEPVFAPETNAATDEAPAEDFLPAERFADESLETVLMTEQVDEAAVIDELLSEQQALFEAEPVKSTPTAKKAQRAIQQLQDAKEGLALELPFDSPPVATEEQVEAAQDSIAKQRAEFATKQVERERQTVAETQAMVQGLGPNYAAYEFVYLPDAPQGKFEIYINNRDGRRMRRSVHKTLKAFTKAVDDLKGVVQEAEGIESDIKSGAGLTDEGYKSSRTVGDKAIQELTAEIDRNSTEGKKKLSNLQRTELLRMLENPVKRYDVGERAGQIRYAYDETGSPIPYTPEERRTDALFREVEKRAKAVRDVQARIDASGSKKKSDKDLAVLRKTLETRNEKLLDAVRNITEPVQARMQSMVEQREDELFGSRQLVEQLHVEEKLGEADLQEMRDMVKSMRPGYEAYLTTQAEREALVAELKKAKNGPLEIAAATRALDAKLKRLKPKHDEYLDARAFLDRALGDLAEVRADRLRAKQDYEEARVFRSLIEPRLEQETMDAANPEPSPDVALGTAEIVALLDNSVKSGKISREGAALAKWFISKNPAITADLLVSLTSLTDGKSAGKYDPVLQGILMDPAVLSRNPSLAVHEILHHTERMLPDRMRQAIRKLWMDDMQAFKKQASGNELRYIELVEKLYNSKDRAEINKNYAAAIDMFKSGEVGRSLYRYLNPSEYWAETGSEIMSLRFDAKDSKLASIKQWYRELLEKLKDLFGKPSAAPVLRALDDVLNSDGTFVTNSMLFKNGSEFNAPKIPLKTAKKLRESGEDISEGLRRAQLTQDVQQIAEDSLGTIKKRLSSGDVFGWLDSVWKATDSSTLATFLKTLPTSGIIGWKQKELPGLQTIVDNVNEMNAMRQNILRASENIAEEINEFMQKHGDETLAKAMTTARINEVSLGDYKTVAEALQKDPVLLEIRNQLAQKPTDPQKGVRLKKAETVRLNQLTDSYGLWEQLGKQPGGQKLYLKLRDYYKTTFIAMRAAQDKIIEGFGDGTASQNLLVQIRREMEEAAARDESDVFRDLSADLFPKDYFPFLRFGKYVLKVAAHKGLSKQFYSFDTPSARDAALQEVATRMKIDPKSPQGRKLFTKVDDIDILQEQFNTDDEMMRRVFDVLQKNKNAGAVGPVEVQKMMNSVYQVYLMSSPERSLRRSFLKSEDVIGMSMDVLRTFSTRASSVANQLARAEYGRKIELASEAAMDNVDPNNERDIDERKRLMTIVNEINNRAKDELDPTAPAAWSNVINRISYLYFLTAPATAAVQFTSIPIRVVPHLGAKFGYANTTKVWGKYSKVWDSVGVGDGNMPNVLNSKLVQKDPLLKEALGVGLRRGVLETLGQTLVNNEAQEAGASKGKIRQYSAKMHNVMTYLFTASENVSKQAAYLMAFELTHDKLMTTEKPTTQKAKDDVFNRAVTESLQIVSDTIGDYSSMERPTMMRGNLGRMVFLFKAYAIAQTKWFIGSMRKAVGSTRLGVGFGDFTSEERSIARKDLAGVFMMAFMFAGATGLPLYTVGAMALKAIADAFDDDEDDREARLRNPYTADDYDMWFRYEFLPSIFGEAEIMGRPLSAIMANGPISELTGTNIASRTGMDLKQMWLRDSPKGDTTLGTVGYALLSNIAAGGLLTNIFKGIDEIAKGDVTRGIEYFMPAFARAPMTAARIGSEGLLTGSDKVIMSPEEFSETNILLQAAGFQPMRASSLQQMRVKIESYDATLKKERASLMDTYADAVRAGASEEEIRDAMQDIIDFNDRRPNPDFVISVEDLRRSLKTRERQLEVRGVTVDRNDMATKERAFAQVR